MNKILVAALSSIISSVAWVLMVFFTEIGTMRKVNFTVFLALFFVTALSVGFGYAVGRDEIEDKKGDKADA